MRTTLFVVDDSPAVRKSLSSLGASAGLEVETYASSDEFLASYDPERAGCLVLDVRLRAGRSGLDLQDELRRRGVTLPIIVLTGYGDVPTSVRALKGGAFDFLQKPAKPRSLLARIRAAVEADVRARDREAAGDVVRRRIARLSKRERQVMDRLLEGESSKQIAAQLDMSVRTVEGHRRQILIKMDVASTTQLLRVVLGQAKTIESAE
jgi:two-component system, LuxR family, response regulator FixJ